MEKIEQRPTIFPFYTQFHRDVFRGDESNLKDRANLLGEKHAAYRFRNNTTGSKATIFESIQSDSKEMQPIG